MATWEDGPEYAPYERPDEFQVPPVEPLLFAPPAPALPAAPPERPVFAEPQAPLAALATLVPTVEDERDPQVPFAVVTDSLTTDSGWGAVRWSAPSTPVAASPWPPPPDPGQFPAPGTPQWFGPGPYAPPPAPQVVSFSQVLTATTPGLIICLVIGGFLGLLAPLMLVISALLANRVKAGESNVRRAFGIAVTCLIAAAVYTGSGAYSFSEWWAGLGLIALVFCWLMVVVVLVIVHRALKDPGSAAPRRATWG
jgi:hypothetical protein